MNTPAIAQRQSAVERRHGKSIRWLRVQISLAGILVIGGCATQPAQAPLAQQLPPINLAPPQKVDISAVKSLLQPCHIELARKYTTAEATRVANARLDALLKCNAEKAAALDKLEHQ